MGSRLHWERGRPRLRKATNKTIVTGKIKSRMKACYNRCNKQLSAGEDARTPKAGARMKHRKRFVAFRRRVSRSRAGYYTVGSYFIYVAALGANAGVLSALPAKPEGFLNGFNKYRILELMLWG